MGKITTHLNLVQCQTALKILRGAGDNEAKFKKLRAAKLTNTVKEMPGAGYFTAMEKRMARRTGVK